MFILHHEFFLFDLIYTILEKFGKKNQKQGNITPKYIENGTERRVNQNTLYLTIFWEKFRFRL